jgi:hypothetical protein
MSGVVGDIVEEEIQHGIGADHGEASGTTGVKPSVKLQIFNGTGWHLWKFKMISYFEWVGVWEVVSGTREPPTDQSSTEYRNKYKKDELTGRNILINVVDSERLQMLTSCNFAPQMWRILEEKFEIISTANEMRLDHEFSNQKQGNKSVDAYLKCINESIDKLRGIGKIVTDKNKLLTFLKGLNKKYNVLTVMLENTENMTFERASALAITHEMRHFMDDTEEEQAEAFPAYRGRGRGRGGRSGRGRGRFATP